MESQGSWFLKTLGLVVLAAVVTALLTVALQQLIWHKSNAGVAGGAAKVLTEFVEASHG